MTKKISFSALIMIVAAVSFRLISSAKMSDAQGNETPLAVHLFPQNQQLKVGEAASWYLTVAGADPIQFQWKLNGIDVPGATTNTLIISSVKTVHQGMVTCSLQNKFGSVETEPVQLDVLTESAIRTSQKIDFEKAPVDSTAKSLESFKQ